MKEFADGGSLGGGRRIIRAKPFGHQPDENVIPLGEPTAAPGGEVGFTVASAASPGTPHRSHLRSVLHVPALKFSPANRTGLAPGFP